MTSYERRLKREAKNYSKTDTFKILIGISIVAIVLVGGLLFYSIISRQAKMEKIFNQNVKIFNANNIGIEQALRVPY